MRSDLMLARLLMTKGAVNLAKAQKVCPGLLRWFETCGKAALAASDLQSKAESAMNKLSPSELAAMTAYIRKGIPIRKEEQDKGLTRTLF